MATTRQIIIQQAQAWLGRNEKDGTHKAIIDIYNTQAKLPRGYKVKYTDEWCATFISALGIKCGATDIIPTECSCTEMAKLHKAQGTFIENDNYTPKVGDLIFYNWSDSGAGDNTKNPNHIGIVEKVVSGVITVIEGNKGEAVARREIKVGGRYIRGFASPRYIEAANKIKVELTELRKGASGTEVKTLQRLLLALGYKMRNGWRTYGVDGSFGQATLNAVLAFQKDRKLPQNGLVEAQTWDALLRG